MIFDAFVLKYNSGSFTMISTSYINYSTEIAIFLKFGSLGNSENAIFHLVNIVYWIQQIQISPNTGSKM